MKTLGLLAVVCVLVVCIGATIATYRK